MFIIGCVLFTIFSGCNEPTVPFPNSVVKKGEVRFEFNKLVAPGAKVLFEGKAFDNEAQASEGKLVAVEYNGKVYLYYTGWKDTTYSLDANISKKAVASFIAQKYLQYNKIQSMKHGSIQSYQWELPTGIGINQNSNNRYDFSNFKYRWAAVDNSKEVKYLTPKTFIKWSFVDWNNILGVNVAETKTIDYYGYPYKTYGSVISAMASPLNNFLIDYDNLKKAFNENPELVMKLNAAEFFDIMITGIEQIVGLLPDGHCLDATAFNFIFNTFKTIGYDLLLGTEGAKDALQSQTEDFFNEMIVCILSVANTEFGGPAVEEFITVLSSLAWVGQVSVGSWDAATSKYYAEFKPNQSNNLSIDVTPSGNQNKIVGESLTYTITVKDQFGNLINSANVEVSDGSNNSQRQLTTNNGGVVTYTLICNKAGNFDITFQASKSGFTSSLQVNSHVIVSLPNSLSINVSPSDSQNKQIGETLTYTITVKDQNRNPVSYAKIVINDGISGSQQLQASDNNGVTTYSINCNKVGTFNNTFKASKSGFLSSQVESRNVSIINLPQSRLSIDVSPSGNQKKQVGETLTYTITVKDQNGNPVSYAKVIINDGILGSQQQCTTNSIGVATYTVNCTKIGTFNNTLQASKSGYTTSQVTSIQVIISQQKGLSIDVSPSGNQNKSVGETINYTITVKENNGNPVNQANVLLKDGLSGSQLQNSTDNKGNTTYSFKCSKDGIFNNTFQASKSGYTSSQVLRSQVTISQKTTLSIDVFPSGNQNRNVGENIDYTITVKDNYGNPVDHANVLIYDGLNGTQQQRTSNSNGVATYTVTCNQAGNFSTTFQATKSGYTSSDIVTRGITVAQKPKNLNVSIQPQSITLNGGDRYSFTVIVTSEGLPVQGVEVTCTVPFGTSYTGITGSDGIPRPEIKDWRVPGDQQGGTYTIRFYASKSGYNTGSGSGTLIVNSPKGLRINYGCPSSPEKAGEYHSISFTVTDDRSGATVSNATITVTIPWCSNCYKDIYTDSNGHARYDGQVPTNMAGVPGTYYFSARKDGYTNSSKYSCTVNVSR